MNPAAPSAAALPLAPAVDAIDALRDFSDRLSPIVVKELRQGLRQPTFVILFLFLQIVLALAVVGSLMAASSGGESTRVEMGGVISGFFFGLFSLAVLIIQPIRALGALASETRSGTIDLLLLTRLDAWRITFGKWLSLMTQSALMLVAITPYLMMRYFLGGMDLGSELLSLLMLFLAGAAACAAGVGLSAIRSVVLRGIFGVGGGIGMLFAVQMIGMWMAMSALRGGGLSGIFSGPYSTLSTASDWIAYMAGIFSLTAFLCYAFLEFGATRIAPPSENRSTRKRLISLGAMAVIPLMFALLDSELRMFAFFVMLLIGIVAMGDALSESPIFTRSAARGRVKAGLLPGWPSGAFFAMVVVAVSLVWWWLISTVFTISGMDADDYNMMLRMQGIAFMVVAQPALILALARPYEREPAGFYISCICGSALLGLVVLMVAAAADAHELVGFVLFPLFPVLGFATAGEESFTFTTFVLLVLFAFLAAVASVGRTRWPLSLRAADPPAPAPPAPDPAP